MINPNITEKALPSIGSYSLYAGRTLDGDLDSAEILCQSDVSPISLRIRYPNQTVEAALSQRETHYILGWPAGIAKKEVAEAIWEVGQQKADAGYHYLSQDSVPAVDTDFPRAFESSPLSLPSSADVGILRQVLKDGFKQLYLVSPELLLAWNEEDELYPNRGGLALRVEDNGPLTDPFIGSVVKRTIEVEHVAGVVVALATLETVFERYKDLTPAEVTG